MSLLFRLGLIIAAVVGAFAGGYLLKSYLNVSTVAAEPQPVAKAPRTAVTATRASLTATTSARTAVVMTTAPTQPAGQNPPTLKVPNLDKIARSDARPAPPPAHPEIEIPDPSDPAFQMIRRELGHKTTVVDKTEPVPEILRDTKRNGPEIPVRKADVAPPSLDLDLPDVRIRVESLQPPVKLVNNRAIELDFEVSKIGLSRIRAVELWATRDGGATWQKIDQMTGCQSPFCTRLTSEGNYGFKLVFESESGQRTREPHSHAVADTSVELDTSPPRIDLFPPELIPGQPAKVRLGWAMRDVHLVADSARLEYSVDGKTWIPIFEGKAGIFYDWTLPPGLPPRVLLRVTARDKAGNVGTAQSSDKVAIDLIVPEGKITRVRAAGAEPEKGPVPRVVDDRQVFSFWVGIMSSR